MRRVFLGLAELNAFVHITALHTSQVCSLQQEITYQHLNKERLSLQFKERGRSQFEERI